MIFPFHLIAEYALKKPAEIERAEHDFFGERPLEESIKDLFVEWLIFDFKQESRTTFLAEYILKNPDNLPDSKMEEFRQIYKTYIYSEFQILSVNPGSHLDLEDVLTSTKYRVYDKLGSSNSQNKGMLRARIASVGNKWYIVGSNPIHLPIIYTSRMKKIIRREEFMKVSVKDTAELLSKNIETVVTPPGIISSKDLKNKRLELEKQYKEAVKKHKAAMSFSRISAEIYNEDRANVLDFWNSLTKKGLTNEFIINEIQLLQDLWNYLPHRCLNGKSPNELYHKLHDKRDKKSNK